MNISFLTKFFKTKQMRFIEAIKKGSISAIKECLAEKPDLNKADKYGTTPLMLAVALGRSDVVNLFLQVGADVNAHDNFHETALHIAAKNDAPAIVSALLHRGADVNVMNIAGETPLHLAAAVKQGKVLSFLLKNGAHPDPHLLAGEKASPYQKTPLHVAVEHGNLSFVKDLIGYGANADAQDRYHNSVLHYAVMQPSQEIYDALIPCVSNIDAPNYLKLTPLHLAIKNKNGYAVASLVDRGADLFVQDHEGHDAHYFATHSGGEKIENFVCPAYLDSILEGRDNFNALAADFTFTVEKAREIEEAIHQQQVAEKTEQPQQPSVVSAEMSNSDDDNPYMKRAQEELAQVGNSSHERYEDPFEQRVREMFFEHDNPSFESEEDPKEVERFAPWNQRNAVADNPIMQRVRKELEPVDRGEVDLNDPHNLKWKTSQQQGNDDQEKSVQDQVRSRYPSAKSTRSSSKSKKTIFVPSKKDPKSL